MSSCNRRQPGRFARLRLPALIVALVMIGTSPALAQVREATLEELRQELSPGDFISLVQTSGESVTGRLRGLRGHRHSTSAAETREDRGQTTPEHRRDITLSLSAIRSVGAASRLFAQWRRSSGQAIGGGVSLGMFVYAAAVDYNEIDEWAPMYLAMGAVYTGVGALVGWAIDSAHSKPHVTIQRAVRTRR